jgi:hypothetical protein
MRKQQISNRMGYFREWGAVLPKFHFFQRFRVPVPLVISEKGSVSAKLIHKVPVPGSCSGSLYNFLFKKYILIKMGFYEQQTE